MGSRSNAGKLFVIETEYRSASFCSQCAQQICTAAIVATPGGRESIFYDIPLQAQSSGIFISLRSHRPKLPINRVRRREA
jgi:hypothetical protein